MRVNFQVWENNKRRWTESALECLERHCVCEGCFIKKIYDRPCFMKECVLALVREHGTPETYIEPIILKEEI